MYIFLLSLLLVKGVNEIVSACAKARKYTNAFMRLQNHHLTAHWESLKTVLVGCSLKQFVS